MSKLASGSFGSATRSNSQAVLFAYLLLNALLAVAAALPVLSLTNDVTLLQPFNASLGSVELITFTKLVLAVTYTGQAIPEEEVKDTLKAANRAIQHEVDTHSEKRIFNNRFEYRRKGGNMLVLIAASTEEGMTWNELGRVLQALYKYMTGGAGVPGQHYEAVEFEVRTLSHIVVGVGLVWYLPPDSSQSQKRALLSPSSALVRDTGLMVSAEIKTADSTSMMSNHIAYSIPHTPVTLIITSLGTHIPSLELGAGLTNALYSSAPGHASSPIPEIFHWYRDKVSRLWFQVRSTTRDAITWQQFNWVVAGLLQWMKDDNCRELAFEFKVIDEGTLGVGSIGYDSPPGGESIDTDGVEKRTAPANETYVQLPSKTTVSLIASPTGECTLIRDMGIKLCFPSFGPDIPSHEVNRMFDGAFAEIRTLAGRDPHGRVPNNIFHYTGILTVAGASISVTIQGSPRATILWIGLHKFLVALQVYMKGIRPGVPRRVPHYQVLEFDIITSENVTMGRGWVHHNPEVNQIGSTTERRSNANNTTPLLHGIASSPPGIESYGRVLMSGSDLEFYFRYHGDAVSQPYINALFHQALLDFPISEDLVPGTLFHRRTPFSKTDGGTSISIKWVVTYGMTYNTLHKVLVGLQKYVNGDYDTHQHWEDLGFELISHGSRIGSGVLWYVSRRVPSKLRGAKAKPVTNGDLWSLPGFSKTTLQQRYNTTFPPLQAPFHFPIPGSPITLAVSPILNPTWGISIELFDLLAAALTEIGPVVEAIPGSTITHNTYARSKHSEQGGALEFKVHAEGDHDIAWQDLKDVIRGLDAFYSYDPETGWYRTFASRFEISKAGKGVIGMGSLSLVGGVAV